MDRLRWTAGLASQPWVRFSIGAGTDRLHDHDFPEWFWIDSGRMRHRHGGRSEDLEVGDLVLLHPAHPHCIVPLTADASHVVLSVEPSLFRRFAQRHRSPEADWPWPDRASSPRRYRLGGAALQRLRGLLDLLPLRDQHPADAELALAATLRVLREAAAADGDRHLPAWLATAVAGLDDPAVAARGVGAFIAACGRSSATVCRAVRRHHGCRPAELVEAARLDHVARRLRCGVDAIVDLAEAAGYASSSHFYRRFTARFGMPPARYRSCGEHGGGAPPASAGADPP